MDYLLDVPGIITYSGDNKVVAAPLEQNLGTKFQTLFISIPIVVETHMTPHSIAIVLLYKKGW